jgi:hypothetical protein
MLRAMNHRTSQWVRATKEGDMDFASFGQTVIQTTMNPTATGLLYRCWHLRDVAWQENASGIADTVYRRWKPTARQLVNLFGKDRVHQSRKSPFDRGRGLARSHPYNGLPIRKTSQHAIQVSVL